MKIEKINDKQIRCTLTREDLDSRKLKLSELAYGSEKAKALFQDMMQLAAQDFGFEADNTPLVIEAVPLSMDAIILIITKVEDPEELDTRFSRFSPESNDTAPSSFPERDAIEGADDILDLFRHISEITKKGLSSGKDSEESDTALPAKADKDMPSSGAASEDSSKPAQTASPSEEELRLLTRMYIFHSMDDAIRSASVVSGIYDGPSSLYRNPECKEYYLLLQKADCPPENFNKVCNILSEYALPVKVTTGMEAHFSEHMKLILKDHAIRDLSSLV